MIFSAKTDKGNVREKNEDYFGIVNNCNEEPFIFIIADGMGGHKGGDIASKLAVETLQAYFSKNFTYDMSSEEVLDMLRQAFVLANKTVLDESKKNENSIGMGTTLSVAIFKDSKIHVGHVGDSRIYLIKNDTMKKITTDHSYTAELLKSGTISVDEARTHPSRNVITRAIGASPELDVDLLYYDYDSSDVYLMCTDGLTNMVKKEEILEIVLKNEQSESICIELVDLANKNGGQDNITVMLINK